VWVARYTGRDGKHHIAKPSWNRGKGTFARKGEAQQAIDEAYGLSDRPDTLGEYFATWIERHPRSERTNPFKGIRIRANDPRAKKKPRPIRVFTFEEMHRFAKAAGRYEAMVRVFTDCGLRLGEVLPLRRKDFDGETFQIRRTAHEGKILDGTKTDHGEPDAGRVVPGRQRLPGCLRPRFKSTARTACCSSRLRKAASGASAPFTEISGSPPRKPPGWMSARTSAAIAS
jgi:integrase